MRAFRASTNSIFEAAGGVEPPAWADLQPSQQGEWLLEEFYPDDPVFPLEPEVVAAIPKDLPGKAPSNGTELYADEPPRRRRAQSADDAE